MQPLSSLSSDIIEAFRSPADFSNNSLLIKQTPEHQTHLNLSPFSSPLFTLSDLPSLSPQSSEPGQPHHTTYSATIKIELSKEFSSLQLGQQQQTRLLTMSQSTQSTFSMPLCSDRTVPVLTPLNPKNSSDSLMTWSTCSNMLASLATLKRRKNSCVMSILVFSASGKPFQSTK